MLIIAGETGSGKTTQLPKMCLDAGLAERGKIGCTQPRRVAAMSISRRVAEELRVPWGREVGCKMRFNDDTSRDTKIKFMTDGILLAEIQSDPLLRSYSAIILDEAHERSLNIDFLLGYLQGLLKKRPDLKLIVTSATIDTEAFSQAFGGAPIIQVSGRLWPVEIRHTPLEHYAGPKPPDDFGYIDAALRATEDALIESDFGDVLIFMPTERDIRDTREALEGSLGTGIEVIGLFGRMPAAEQQRIFSPGARRRVIVATNIAETSITLPRIRFVIDAGLSRMSRYNPRTRTKRLPVEDISQSSANQRAGRAGRVQDGICIRLYDADDFEKRPRFTQPEIQRANLAEVILRMKAFRLGEIETFPFLNPPVDAAIRAGYRLLHELGAITDENELTPLGKELARLPLDPTLGRMLLHAREEDVLPEVLVIAAGLSIPDPRERPEEDKEAAATAHRVFADKDSDFLTLLNIWNAAPDAEGRGGSNALRRFCKANYLSQSRMREWRDIYRQLEDAMYDGPGNRPPRGNDAQQGGIRARQTPQNTSRGQNRQDNNARQAHREQQPPAKPQGPPQRLNRAPQKQVPEPESQPADYDYTEIHRSILCGLLGQIAQRQEKNTYKASGNRIVTLFPGSSLYERREKQRKAAPDPKKPAEKSNQSAWIMSGEIVETSQLFARTVANISPDWVLQLGPHLCQFRHTEPHWSAKAGRVLALERVLIHGLEIARRQIDYGKIEPVEATELFIRGALVSEEARLPLRFFEENQKLRDKIETALTRVRSPRAHDLDESLFRFYSARIEGVSSIHDLNRLVQSRIAHEPDFLCASEEELIGGHDTSYDRTLFPDKVSLGNTALPVTYSYNPGEEVDGVTLRIPLPIAAEMTTGQLHWAVPGLRLEQISVLLRALPKSVRKTLMPLDPKIREVAAEFQPGREDFHVALAAHLSRKYRTTITATDWPPQSLPAHLHPRVEIIDQSNKTVAFGRDLTAIQAAVESKGIRSTAWDRAVQRWEKYALSGWTFGDLPEAVVVEDVGGAPLYAYPGLEIRETAVDVRIFRKKEASEAASAAGVRKLGELVLARDLSWLRKELGTLGRGAATGQKQAVGFHDALHQLTAKASPAGPVQLSGDVLQESAYLHLVHHALTLEPISPLTHARFEAMLAAARKDLPALTHRVRELTKQIMEQRQKVLASPKRYAGMEQDVQRLVPGDFLAVTPHSQLPHLLRYLKAVQIRAERAALTPAKDIERMKQLAPFNGWEKRVPAAKKDAFRWMLEEFRVSLFAQELGTAQPVSAQRLNALAVS